MLALLAAASVMACALPDDSKPPLAGLVLLHGLLRARRAASEAPCGVEWPGGARPATIDRAGRRIELRGVELLVRGPIVRLQGRDPGGRHHRLFWWPDTLPAGARRQLLLAARDGRRSDINLPSMAA